MDDDTVQEAGQKPAGALEYKALEWKVDDVDDDGTFEGYASVFGVTDAYGDVIESGSFKKTIREQKGRVPILWQHDSWEPIGVSLELSEDDHGLKAKGQLVLPVRRATEAYELMKAGALKGLSIGYRPVKYLIEKENELGVRRRLKEIELWEFSPVTFPANKHATVTNVKSGHLAELAHLLRELRDAPPELVMALLEREPADATRTAPGAATRTARQPATATAAGAIDAASAIARYLNT